MDTRLGRVAWSCRAECWALPEPLAPLRKQRGRRRGAAPAKASQGLFQPSGSSPRSAARCGIGPAASKEPLETPAGSEPRDSRLLFSARATDSANPGARRGGERPQVWEAGAVVGWGRRDSQARDFHFMQRAGAPRADPLSAPGRRCLCLLQRTPALCSPFQEPEVPLSSSVCQKTPQIPSCPGLPFPAGLPYVPRKPRVCEARWGRGAGWLQDAPGARGYLCGNLKHRQPSARRLLALETSEVQVSVFGPQH